MEHGYRNNERAGEDVTLRWLRFEFVIEDFWIGVYWRVGYRPINAVEPEAVTLDVYVCVVPFVPLHLRWERAV
jgi:hypothetical protein